MSFNEDELIKIKKATSGFLKKSARKAISQSLLEIERKIENAKKLADADRQVALKELLNRATADRKRAVQYGATSYGNPQWAAAAACESWLQELILGTPDGIARVEALIRELSQRG